MFCKSGQKKKPHLKWNWPNSLKCVFYCHQNRLATMLNFLVFTYIVHCRHQKRTCCIRGVLESYEFLLVCHFMSASKLPISTDCKFLIFLSSFLISMTQPHRHMFNCKTWKKTHIYTFENKIKNAAGYL